MPPVDWGVGVGYRVELKLKAEQGSDHTLGGAELELLAPGKTVRQTTDVTGTCRFDDVEPGAYEVRIVEPPAFYTVTATVLPVTVVDRDVTQELAVAALAVKVTLSAFTQTGFRRPRVEVRTEAGEIVASAEVGEFETAIPVSRSGTYAVVQTVTGEGFTEPPADERKIVVLSAAKPSATVEFPQKMVMMSISVVYKKEVNGSIDEVEVSGGRATVRGPDGLAVTEHDLPAELPVQRTGKHSIVLIDLPEPYVVSAPTQEPNVTWAGASPVAVKFEAVAQGSKSPRAIVLSWFVVGLFIVAGFITCIIATPGVRSHWKSLDGNDGARLAAVGAGLLAVGFALALVTLAGRNRRGLLTRFFGFERGVTVR